MIDIIKPKVSWDTLFLSLKLCICGFRFSLRNEVRLQVRHFSVRLLLQFQLRLLPMKFLLEFKLLPRRVLSVDSDQSLSEWLADIGLAHLTKVLTDHGIHDIASLTMLVILI